MRQLVTIEIIQEVKPIAGADMIEAVRVRDWWVVSKKGEFPVGAVCCFYEIDSFLPDRPEYEFLRRGKTLKRMVVDGQVREGIVLKSIRLRGQLSQGLVMRLPVGLTGVVGDDISEQLGVIKYEIPLPAELQGKAKGFFPDFIPKTDEERIQNISEVLGGYYVSEKIDGSSTTFFKKDGILGVCSRNLEIAEGNSTQWQMARKYDLANKLPEGMAIQCELIGEGIQKNPLRQTGQDIYCFNVFVIEWHKYLNYYGFVPFCQTLGVKTVPIIDDNYWLPRSVDELLTFSEGKSLLNPSCEREGIVIRPKVEREYKGQRLSFKVISNKYLLKEE
jgi:RNA ligase (TIGR02306 family)